MHKEIELPVNYTFSLFKNKFDKRATPITQPWAGWVSLLAVHEPRGTPDLSGADKDTLDAAKDGEAFVLGVITEGHPHQAEEVIEIHALALDLDGATEEQAEAALAVLTPFTYALYTTYKHGADVARFRLVAVVPEGATVVTDPATITLWSERLKPKIPPKAPLTLVDHPRPRLRVIVPLREPVKPADFADVWVRFNSFVGGINDPSTKDINRLHFLPATFDPRLAFSTHHDGAFLSAHELPVARALTLVPAPAAPPAHAPTALDEQDTLQRLRHRITSANRQALGDQLSRWVQLLKIGDSLADKGGRHEAIEKITWWLSGSPKDRDLSENVLGQLFEKSIEVMEKEDPSWDGMKEVFKLYYDGTKKRAQKAIPQGTTPYTQQELDFIAARQGWTIGDLKKRWVVQAGDSYFFLQKNGFYSKPARGLAAGRTHACQELACAPVVLNEVGPKGVRKRTISDIVEAHGYCVSEVLVDLTAEGTYLDVDEAVLHEAPSPMRLRLEDGQPDPEIAGWLKILGGDQHEALLDWLAVFPDLSRLNVGLYIKGTPGAGKSLLCSGLSRLWTQGSYTPMEEVFGSFNEKLTKCPLVVGDEQIPFSKQADPSALVRRLLGNKKHDLKAKYKTSASLVGAVRLILTANNSDLLRAVQQTRDDREAVVTRFLVLEATDVAANYLTRLGGANYVNRWIEEDRIAKHVLHLAVTRPVVGDRFANKIVTETEGHRQVFMSKWGQMVTEWMVSFALNPAPLDAQPDMRTQVRVGEGEFLINSRAISQCWQMYLPQMRQEPNVTAIGHALSVLSLSKTRVQRTLPNGDRMNYYKIDVRNLQEFVEATGYGNGDAILRVLNRKHPALPAQKSEQSS